MKISDFPQDLEPRVGDILEIEQGDVCFEVRIIGITADGYLCEQDNVEGAVLLEGLALDHDDVADITGYITEERVRLDPKCWKGKKIGNPKTKMKGGVRVNNCVPEGQEVEEAGPFRSTEPKKPRKGSVAYWAEKKRKEQEKGKPPIEPKDQMVGVAKVTKAVSEGSDNNVYFEVDSEKAYNHIMKKFRSIIDWDGDTMVAPQKYWGAIQELAYSVGGEAIEVGNEQGVAETSDYFRRREREEGIISGKRPARKKAPAQTSDYAKRREQEKKAEQGVSEGSDLPPKVIEMIKKIAQSSASPEHKKAAIDALVAKYSKKGVAEGPGFDKWADDRAASQLHKLKKPHPETWHDVDKKLGKAVDKMSQAEKVKKGLAHPDTLKKKGVAEGKEDLHAQLQAINQKLKLMKGGPVGEPNSIAFVEKRKALLKQKEQILLQLKQGVNESTEQSLQKKIQSRRDALGLAREQRRARGQHQQGQREIKLQAEIDNLNDQLRELKKQGVKEGRYFRTAYGYAGGYNEKTGGKYKHPEDIRADREAKKKTKDQEQAEKKPEQKVQEGPEEHEYSLSMGNRQRPGSDRLDTDSRSRMDSLRAQEHDLKQRTINILLKRHPDLKRSDLESEPSLPKLIDMLRKPANEDMDEAKYQGREVPLGKKMAGDVAKSKVYVRKPNGKVVKVNFGDKNMTIKKSNPARRKSFRARHNCDNPGPRWRARYWSCRSW